MGEPLEFMEDADGETYLPFTQKNLHVRSGFTHETLASRIERFERAVGGDDKASTRRMAMRTVIRSHVCSYPDGPYASLIQPILNVKDPKRKNLSSLLNHTSWDLLCMHAAIVIASEMNMQRATSGVYRSALSEPINTIVGNCIRPIAADISEAGAIISHFEDHDDFHEKWGPETAVQPFLLSGPKLNHSAENMKLRNEARRIVSIVKHAT